MTPAEYLDAAKAALQLPSDYALAKAMGIHRSRLFKIRNGKHAIDEAEIVFLAATLELDPALVMADLGEQRTKNVKKKELLRGFLSRAAVLAALCCTLALSCLGGAGSEPGRLGGFFKRPRFA
jgi:plasmid maintenance system antidote protein VapI